MKAIFVWLLLLASNPLGGSASPANTSATGHETKEKMINGLGARVHMFVRQAYRERFTKLFRETLLCDVKELNFGLPYPILLVSFPDGSAFSVEFTDSAPEDASGSTLDDAHAFRGAWIEFRTHDVAAVQEKLRVAGIRSFSHPGSKHVYFSAPGGQVFRIIDVNYKGP